MTGYDAWSFYYAQCVIVHANADEPICFIRAQDAGGAFIKTYLKKENIIKGPVHLGVGQEAIACGISKELLETDKSRSIVLKPL